jgi:hypothetical protein
MRNLALAENAGGRLPGTESVALPESDRARMSERVTVRFNGVILLPTSLWAGRVNPPRRL